MKVGLEVHQQLSTGKLFCRCPPDLTEEVRTVLLRRLRATGGESRALDPAVVFEATRGIPFRYQSTPSNCLVEADEEPPHELDPAALDAALTVALLLHARPVDEILVMRKIVIDGSNTSGFQRTALVAVDGKLKIGDREYSIPTICLEEDAARRVEGESGEGNFRLDRLGIPLVEVATGPEISSPAEAREVAAELGLLLRSTNRVRRGIGTIREDLNVSIPGGTRIEIKGVQELRKIPRYVEAEVERQEVLLGVQKQIGNRPDSSTVPDPFDVTEQLRGVREGPLRELSRGGVAFALRLPGFAGLLASPQGRQERLGRELADHVRSVGLRGILHSDELPGHGVTDPLLETIRKVIGAESGDAFVLLVAPDRRLAELGASAIRGRIGAASLGIPAETRDPLPDGRSRYSRPLSGMHRMYPETDVPPVPILRERIARLRAVLPENPRTVQAALAKKLGLSGEIVRQLQRDGSIETFQELVDGGEPATQVARLLTQDLAAAQEAAGAASREPSLAELRATLAAVRGGTISKEGIPIVLAEMLRGTAGLEEAIGRTGLATISPEELDRMAQSLVQRNEALVRERGAGAHSALMGDLMREVRGRRDGKEVAASIQKALRRHTTDPSAPA